MAKLWLGKVRALFHFILSLRIDMKKRVYRNFDTPSRLKMPSSIKYKLPLVFAFCPSMEKYQGVLLQTP